MKRLKNTKSFWSRGEVRLNDDGTIDEIVTGQLTGIHLEQLDDDFWWMSLDGRNGRRISLNFFRKGKCIHVTADYDGYHGSSVSEGFKK